MKTITIAGNVGKDAETRQLDGNSVTSWTVAVDDRMSGEKSTMWFDVSMWGKRGQTVAPYVTKGSKIVVTGELGSREHNGKTYFTVRADQVTLMGRPPSGDGRPAPQAQSRDMPEDGDIPF